MNNTKEQWVQTGSIIVAYGKDGAVICNMAEPNPESSMVEFAPLKIGSSGWDLQMANAEVIVTAVNACMNLNPENPVAAAQSLSGMYEALKATVEDDDGLSPELDADREALAKAESK